MRQAPGLVAVHRGCEIEAKAASPFRWTIRDSCEAIVLIAVALGLARQPGTWWLLDSDRNGMMCAKTRFGVFWLGVALTFLLGKKRSSRFFGLAWTLLASWAVMLLFPSLQFGRSPDLPAMFSGASVETAIALFVAGWIAKRFEGKPPHDRG